MNRLSPPLLLMLVVATVSYLAGCKSANSEDASAGASSAADIRSIAIGLSDRHTQGLLNKDVAALDKLWADDFAFINLRGQLLSKADRLENLRTSATSFKSLEVTDHQVHALGKDGFVLTCHVKIDGQYSGAEGSGNFRCSLSGARRHGEWKLVTVTMTRVAQ